MTHTKDDFQWTPDQEGDFLKKLKEELEKEPRALLSQADRFRKDRRSRDLRIQSEEGLSSSIKKIQGSMAVLEEYKPPKNPEISQKLPEAKPISKSLKAEFFEKIKPLKTKLRCIYFEDEVHKIKLAMNYNDFTKN